MLVKFFNGTEFFELDNRDDIELRPTGAYRLLSKKGNNYYYHCVCKECGNYFLACRKNSIFCCRSCQNSGSKNGRYNDHRNWEELLGKERADKLKEKKRQEWAGNNNLNFGNKHWIHHRSNAFLLNWKNKIKLNKIDYAEEHTKNKTYEEIYGEERSMEIREKISINTKKNMPKNFVSSHISGYGICGSYKGYNFRSTLELSYIKYLIDKGIPFVSAERGNVCKIPYINSSGLAKNYIPDFIVNDYYIVEIKPDFKLKDQEVILKSDAATKLYGDKFVVVTSSDLKNSGILLKNKYIYNMMVSGEIDIPEKVRRRVEKWA
jgi:hypothetical protein